MTRRLPYLSTWRPISGCRKEAPNVAAPYTEEKVARLRPVSSSIGGTANVKRLACAKHLCVRTAVLTPTITTP